MCYWFAHWVKNPDLGQEFCVSWTLKMYILNSLQGGGTTLYTKLCLEHIFFNLVYNSRLNVLQDGSNCFLDKENSGQRIGEMALLGWHRVQTLPSSNTRFISAGSASLGNTAVMLGQPRSAPNCALGQALPETLTG